MLLVMCVSLYTVRVVLKALGQEDYGINNVVGGVVTMFGFLSTTMSGASMRFFSYELGRKDYDRLAKCFSVTFWCYVILVSIVFILAETVGLWFVNTKLVIPPERMNAALWVYHCSIISFVFYILAVPFNSLILAREKMDLYAYLGIIDVVLKLLVAFMITISPIDKLASYAVLLMITTTLISSFYIFYDLWKFPESRVKKFWDGKIFKEVFNYSSWSLFGAVSLVLRGQGINILLNIFFGPVVNAARAIAYQVNGAINHFVTGFTQTVRPQITKYYAAQETGLMLILVYRATRLCFFLIFLLSVPILLETEFILRLWLGTVSETTVLFTRLVIIASIIEAIATPLKGLISATGNIKYTQVINGTILISILPVSYVFLKLGYPPETTMIIAIVSNVLCHITRIYFSCRLTAMIFSDYTKETIVPISIIALIGGIISVLLYFFIGRTQAFHCILVVLLSTLSNATIIWIIGIKKNEKKMIIEVIKSKLRKSEK
jgi:O-antigen/teichoic acid export membrane protein